MLLEFEAKFGRYVLNGEIITKIAPFYVQIALKVYKQYKTRLIYIHCLVYTDVLLKNADDSDLIPIWYVLYQLKALYQMSHNHCPNWFVENAFMVKSHDQIVYVEAGKCRSRKPEKLSSYEQRDGIYWVIIIYR